MIAGELRAIADRDEQDAKGQDPLGEVTGDLEVPEWASSADQVFLAGRAQGLRDAADIVERHGC